MMNRHIEGQMMSKRKKSDDIVFDGIAVVDVKTEDEVVPPVPSATAEPLAEVKTVFRKRVELDSKIDLYPESMVISVPLGLEDFEVLSEAVMKTAKANAKVMATLMPIVVQIGRAALVSVSKVKLDLISRSVFIKASFEPPLDEEKLMVIRNMV